MNILLFDMGSFTYQDIKQELEIQGHMVEGLYYHFKNRYSDQFFEERIALILKRGTYDVVVSINFFPLLAVACHGVGIPYISWSYDSPLDERLSDYFAYDTNVIFLFDREEVKHYNKLGFTNVLHLPLAINTRRLGDLKIVHNLKYKADISFVGKIYNSQLDILVAYADDYVKGYIEGLFQSQIRIYGCNFLEQSIPDQIIDSLNESYEKIGQSTIKLTKKGLAYAIASQITHFERSFLLEEFAELYDTHVYTADECRLSEKVKISGPVKYYDEMNQVFVCSKLNLCPTLKSISSGIPLRALDIMGVGGALFSNYQSELAEYFVDGKDVIMYESIEDAFDKADFYLRNQHLIEQIAQNGSMIAREHFSYKDRIGILLRSI